VSTEHRVLKPDLTSLYVTALPFLLLGAGIAFFADRTPNPKILKLAVMASLVLVGPLFALFLRPLGRLTVTSEGCVAVGYVSHWENVLTLSTLPVLGLPILRIKKESGKAGFIPLWLYDRRELFQTFLDLAPEGWHLRGRLQAELEESPS
jgi:hypothetical protein